ncbi:Pimeloyl-ACP methyl ester carboxylesterase [Oceanobacillus limi]|uniref:Pimeloyl-ACP methyl ester carboxylesterase n=1 Tax=Oceanobacillus limi TaxID=930131 RepID=A0A1I0CTH3_9BACI|nr:Pimeloyl-ACP methyl ester carboxylesterase [Oceanobacillus limi]
MIQLVFLKHGHIRINYEWIQSENPFADETLIFIHGIGLDMHTWEFVIPYLRKYYDIVTYDLRGHGKSDSGDEKGTVELLYKDFTFLLSELEIKSYHIVAQGFGGLIGVYHAAQEQKLSNQLRSLILLSVPFHYPKKLGSKVVRQRKELVEGQDNMLGMGKELIDKICYPPTKEKQAIIFNAYKKVSPTVYFNLFHTDDLPNATRNLQKIEKPILILSGSEDEVFPPELNSASLNFNVNVRYYTVPYASFLVQMDQPKITADWIHNFIEKQRMHQEQGAFHKDLTAELYTEIRGMLHEEDQHELEVNIMNGFGVSLNKQRILEGWGKRKAKQILVYLLLQHSSTRDELCDVFWPEVDLNNARNRLRVALHHLNHLLQTNSNTKFLVTEREHVYLQGNIKSDLVDHIEAIKAAQHITDLDKRARQYQEILSQITENPLPGLYEEWFLNKRYWIERKWGDMSIFLAERFEQRGMIKDAFYYMKVAYQYQSENYDVYQRLTALEEKLP